jgi:hypothetical protein
MNTNIITVECECCYHTTTFFTGATEETPFFSVYCPICGYPLGIQISGTHVELLKIKHPIIPVGHFAKIKYKEIEVTKDHIGQFIGIKNESSVACLLCEKEKADEAKQNEQKNASHD